MNSKHWWMPARPLMRRLHDIDGFRALNHRPIRLKTPCKMTTSNSNQVSLLPHQWQQVQLQQQGGSKERARKQN